MNFQSRFVNKVFIILSLLCFFIPGSLHATESLIAHWKFDDGAGTAPVDSGPNNITAAFTATNPTWSATVPSVAFTNPYSLNFAGTNDAVTISWPAGLNFGATDPRTFSFWYKPTANGEGQYSRLISWSSDQLEIAGTEAGPDTHKITYYDGNWHATDITLSIGTWYHVTFTYDGTTAKFYIGNELQDEHPLAGRALSGTLKIGNRVQDGNEGINGLIDDVRIYNYALTSTQVGNLAAGSNNPDSAPDSTAPVISAVASSTSSTGATVTWTTDEAASTKVVYSVDNTFASSTTETDTSTRVTSHSKAVSNLSACTTYSYKVVSADAAGNYATSSAYTLNTSGCVAGVTPTSATSTVVTVSGAATSTATNSLRSFSVASPANFTATSSSVVIQIKGLPSSSVLDSIGKPSNSLTSAASIAFDVKALINNTTELDSFDLPVTVSYTYTDSDISGLDESSLVMYHYRNSTWSALNSCSVNTGTNTITCSAPHFSVFAIFGNPPASSSGGSNTVAASAIPWCSGPQAPGWQAHLPDGGCGKKDQNTHAPLNTAPVKVCSWFPFGRVLTQGMKGEDVRALQKLLNCLGFEVAKTGPGSPGNETDQFMSRTKNAVMNFQKTYSTEVLQPLNLSKATGIFGDYSKRKAQALLR